MDSNEFDVTITGGISDLSVDSDRIEECIRYYRENGIDRLSINVGRGYKRRDVEFLTRHDDLTTIDIVLPYSPPFDLSGLSALKRLRRLTLSAEVPISLAQFPMLTEFRGYWNEALELPKCPGIEVLDLSQYKPKSGDLSALPDLPALRDLTLVQSPISSLRGLARYPRLRKLTLAYLTKLRSVAEVTHLPDLEDLDVNVCKKIEDHEAVRVLEKLRVLKYNDCGQMPSVAFVNEMPALESFAFVGTNVLDGDLRPLIRLKYAGFSGKKHYSHTPKQLDELMMPHGGAAIPRLRGD